jgi:hypothetical protein
VADDQWGVVVNEVKINATGCGANWWAEMSARMVHTGVLIELDAPAIVGGTQFMRCDDRESAEFAAKHIGEHTHPTAAQASTLAAARKSIRTRHAKRYDHERGCMYCRDDERNDRD